MSGGKKKRDNTVIPALPRNSLVSGILCVQILQMLPNKDV